MNRAKEGYNQSLTTQLIEKYQDWVNKSSNIHKATMPTEIFRENRFMK
jgi:hypothetical protein